MRSSLVSFQQLPSIFIKLGADSPSAR